MTVKNNRKCTAYTAILILVFCVVFYIIQNVFAPTYISFAGEKEYSNVLDDLEKDDTFDAEYYPVVANDYTLKIIQIAESSDKELFVYAYQPCGKVDMRASSINVSTNSQANIAPRNYKLKYINSNGVFFKYVIEGITVSDAKARYYGVTSIYRLFNKDYGDKDAEHGNTVTEVPFNVSKEYRFSTINGNIATATVDIETITITDKFVGFVRYMDGFKLYVGACDSHFVAFNTDKPIDRLLEADVYFTKQQYVWQSGLGIGTEEYFKDKTDEYAYLKYTDKVEHSGGGLLAATYQWERIESLEQFLAENDLTQNVYSGAIIDIKVATKISDEGKGALKNKKWVLRFAETSYSLTGGLGSTTEHSTLVGDVTILRLKFETDGVTYNLGVIDNKQTGSNSPINDTETIIELNDRGKGILIALAVILLIILLCVFAPLLTTLLQFVCTAISAPFKAAGRGLRAVKRKRNNGREEQ